jgi:hypothetical protein
MPTRIQRQRRKGWRLPANAVSVTRPRRSFPGRWGNPFREKKHGGTLTQAECLRLFESYARVRMVQDPGWLEPLRGKDLACWCQPGDACHADILLRLANG